MKKLLFLILTLFLTLSASASKYASWYCAYFDDRYDITSTASNKGDGEYCVSIDIFTRKEGAQASIYLTTSDEVRVFRNKLILLRDKFVDWKKTAIENNVTHFTKAFPTNVVVTISWYYYNWYFDIDHRFTPQFLVMEDGRIVCAITDVCEADTQEYETTKVYFVLSSEEEFNSIINALDDSTIRKSLGNNLNADDLFK